MDNILVPTILTAKASKELEKEVVEELKIKDPVEENTLAKLIELIPT